MSVQGEPLTNKLLFLFLLDKMDFPLTEQTLIDILTMSPNEWINYVDYVDTRDSLLEDEFIINQSNAKDPMYQITAKGRTCLADFYTNIPSSIRTSISDFVKKNKKIYKIKQECVSDFYKNKDGTYTVVLKILELQQTTFELKLNVPTRQIAKNIHSNWEKKAQDTWQNIYENLVD